jgi:hypothetical protein
MKRTNVLPTLLMAIACLAAPPAQARQPLAQQTITGTLDSWISNTEAHLVPVAEVMPGDKYSFVPPSVPGNFKDVRTFAEQVKHLAANNYRMAALIVGDTPTADMDNESGPDGIRTKPQIVEYLKGSFAALHKAVGTIGPLNLVEPVKSPSAWQKTRLSFAVDAVAHSFDHYGQLVEYLRMNGIVPPDSQSKKPE